ncbi:hypothetical protein BBJ28_00008899 [Nothophytophthora sp. Chile5]|nr:hypothetical protein BBJ28_00008899 [Nothophytophthora sp. Chile5]
MYFNRVCNLTEESKEAMSQSFRGDVEALRGMFPAWDVQVLGDLLEAHQGDLGTTIDSVLTMDEPSSAPTPPPAPQSPKRTTASRSHRVMPPSSSPSGQPRRRARLPDDFLRLPADGGSLADQEQRDAILAQMMQDEFFRDELLASQEFSDHFQGNRPAQRRGSATGAYPAEKSASEIASETYAVMSEKLTSMSEGEEALSLFLSVVLTPIFSFCSHLPLMADDSSDSSDSSDDDLGDNPDVRRRNMDPRRSQGSPRRWSPSAATRRSSAYSKKDN